MQTDQPLNLHWKGKIRKSCIVFWLCVEASEPAGRCQPQLWDRGLITSGGDQRKISGSAAPSPMQEYITALILFHWNHSFHSVLELRSVYWTVLMKYRVDNHNLWCKSFLFLNLSKFERLLIADGIYQIYKLQLETWVLIVYTCFVVWFLLRSILNEWNQCNIFLWFKTSADGKHLIMCKSHVGTIWNNKNK